MPAGSVENLWSRIAWVAGTGTVVVSALWAAMTYSHGNRLTYERPLIDKQVALCFEISETVGTLVATEDAAVFDAKRQDFWRFYWGPLVMVEGPSLASAMVGMGQQLKTVNFNGRQALSSFALDVARECRHQIETTLDQGWRMRASDIMGIKFGS